METDTRSVIATYEGRIHELERKKVELSEKTKHSGAVLPDFDKSFR